MLLITIIALPISNRLFKYFFDKGYVFAKPIGIAISGFFMWFLSSLKILKFNYTNSLICVGILAIISFFLVLKDFRKINDIKNNQEQKDKIKNTILKMIAVEIVFLTIFIIAAYIKGFNPGAACGQEKYMDFGFMKIMDKSDYLPPEDMWLSGNTINYYYWGQYIATYITKLSLVGVEYGYNLSLITILSISFMASFSIVYNLLKLLIKEEKIKSNNKRCKILPIIGGMIAALSNTIAGNMHYVLYGLLKILPSKFDEYSNMYGYRYSNSTRYIGYNPNVSDKTITEFPSYSFVISDLHAHVVNIIFVLTVIALLLAYVFSKRKIIDEIKDEKKSYIGLSLKKNAIKELLNPIIIFIGFFIGIFKMTNFWDFPIYLVVTFMTLICVNYMINEKKINGIIIAIIQIIEILMLSSIVSLAFSLNFTKMASEIKFATKHSPIYQLLILWGLPIITIVYFVLLSIIKTIKKNGIRLSLEKYLLQQKTSDIFIIIIGICAIGLIIMPEIVYVKDIYGDTYQRTNTMFKLTYQAYLMFSLCMGYILSKFVLLPKTKRFIDILVGVTSLTLFVLTLGYGYNAVSSYYGNFFDKTKYKGLNAVEFLENYSYEKTTAIDDKIIIDWLNENANNKDNIVEGASYSYKYGNTISVFTGLSTPIGWHTHEWLWRSIDSSTDCPEIVTNRTNEVKEFYESRNLDFKKDFIKKYDIDYIIIGNTERIKYIVDENTLKQLGEIVLETNKSEFERPSYIIKCNI